MGLERQLLMPETGKAGKSTQAVMELCAYLNPGYVLPEKINLVTSLLAAKVIGFHGPVTILRSAMPDGIGLPEETTAGNSVWTLSALKRRPNKTSLKES